MLTPGRDLSVRLCVCVCVCVSVTAFDLNTLGPILMKLEPHDLPKKKLFFLSEGILLLFLFAVNSYDIIYHKNHEND